MKKHVIKLVRGNSVLDKQLVCLSDAAVLRAPGVQVFYTMEYPRAYFPLMHTSLVEHLPHSG